MEPRRASYNHYNTIDTRLISVPKSPFRHVSIIPLRGENPTVLGLPLLLKHSKSPSPICERLINVALLFGQFSLNF